MKNYTLAFALLAVMIGCKPNDPSDPTPDPLESGSVALEFQHTFGGNPLTFNQWHVTPPGDSIQFTRLDYIMSDVFLVTADGDTISPAEDYEYAFVRGADGNGTWNLGELPGGEYAAIGFTVGLEDRVNTSNPNLWPANHPLNPIVNNMHWGWADGYVFTALEGRYINSSGSEELLLLHIAFQKNRKEILINQDFTIDGNATIELEYEADMLFMDPNEYRPDRDGNFTHSSSTDNGLSVLVSANIPNAIEYKGIRK